MSIKTKPRSSLAQDWVQSVYEEDDRRAMDIVSYLALIEMSSRLHEKSSQRKALLHAAEVMYERVNATRRRLQ